MGVDGESGDAERHTKHNVGGLPADAGQGDQILDPGRHLTAKLLHQGRTAGDDGFCLDVEKPGGLDHGLHRLGIGMRQRGGIGIPGE